MCRAIDKPRRGAYCVAGRGHSSTPPLRLSIAASFLSRATGLLLDRYPAAHHGLWLKPCRAVHTVGMRRPIDVVFLDRHLTVLHVVHSLQPNRAAWCWGAYSAVELPAQYCRRHPHFAAALKRAAHSIVRKGGHSVSN